MVLGSWLVGAGILSVAWLVTRPPSRDDARGRPTGRPQLVLGFLLLVGGLVVAGREVAGAIVYGSPSNTGSARSLAFGTGGSACTVTGTATVFPLGVEIRHVLAVAPPIPAGSTVTVRFERNGTENVGRRENVHIDEPSDCIYSIPSALPVGRYRIEMAISPGMLPPISGEFEVTP
jgi:hypothetical protein